jgi:hypothetical protein
VKILSSSEKTRRQRYEADFADFPPMERRLENFYVSVRFERMQIVNFWLKDVVQAKI